MLERWNSMIKNLIDNLIDKTESPQITDLSKYFFDSQGPNKEKIMELYLRAVSYKGRRRTVEERLLN